MKDSGVPWIGEIPEEWEIKKLKYIVSIIGGNGFPDNLQGKDNGDYPFCKVSDINGNDDYVTGAVNWISKSTAQQFRVNIVPKGSILMAKIGAALSKNHRKINTVDCCIDNNTQALVPKENTSTRHLLYVSKCIDMSWFDNSGTIPSVNNSKLLNLYVPIPSVSIRKEISDYLDDKCSKIDAIIAKQEQIIEKLKLYKQAQITEAVLHGIKSNAEMKKTEIEWIGSVPAHWKEYRISNLYDQTAESGEESLPILSVSINTGISDKELSDSELDRVFVRSEDRTKYKRVRPGDLAYNMMRAWQGAFGAVRVDGMVSPAYVTCSPKKNVEIDSRYIEYLFRTPIAIEEMHRFSHGVADFRLRLYWPEFKNIRLCLPPINEQNEIADYIDKQNIEIDQEISRRRTFITKLTEYKKSLIYEVVTGKKEIPLSATNVLVSAPAMASAPPADETWDQTGIKTRVIEEIRRFAVQYQMVKVILFGSRARGNYRRESDIDLAVSGGDIDMFRLAVEEQASTLLRFDVVNLELPLQPGFRETIEKEGKVVYEKV